MPLKWLFLSAFLLAAKYLKVMEINKLPKDLRTLLLDETSADALFNFWQSKGVMGENWTLEKAKELIDYLKEKQLENYLKFIKSEAEK